MSLDAMVGRSKATTANFCHLDRSELDDLLDEILGDQLFVSNFTSQGKAEAPSVNGKQRDNAEQLHAGNEMMTQQCNSYTSATDGATTATSSAPKMEVVNQVPQVEFNPGRNDPGRGSVPTPPASGMYEEKPMESHVLPGGRNRTPSLPGNHLALEHRRRLQSVPCNDYYGMQNSQNYYAAGSGRFVHGMCSEEPITWLDQQKMKLRTRQESKGWIGQVQGQVQGQIQGQVQSPQQKQLMEELKAAQLLCAQKRAELNNTAEQYTEYNNNNYSHLTHEQAPTNESFVHQTYIGNGDLRAEKSTSSSVSLQSDASNGENGKDVCKSERSYYVSGIERPPFTTHQTKYVFSVSSPHASGRYPGSTSPTLMQKASTTCSPPTPLRGESSREAMKQTTMVHDWDLEQWEQGSHTSLSSRSDATERSVVMLPNAGKGMDVGMWNTENHAQHYIPTSAAAATAIERDGVWSVGAGAAPVNWSAPNGDLRPPSGAPEPVNWHSPNGDLRVPSGANAPVYWPPPNGDPRPSVSTVPVYYHSSNGDLKGSGIPAPVNWHVPNGDLRPTGVAMHVPSIAGVPKPVPTSVSSSPAIVMDSAPAFASSHESSSVSAQGFSTSHGLPPQNYNGHLSENHSDYKSSKALSRPSPTSFGFHPDASFGSSVTSAALLSQSAAPTNVVPTPVASSGKAPNGIASTAAAAAAAAAPSVVASAAMATSASMSRSQGQAAPQIPTTTTTMGQQSYSTGNRKEDANINNAQNWQLSSITEQPSAPEITSEVISLRLIGPGMQKLEPDGTLPAVRPVTPKFPHPGMDGSLSFSHQTTSRVSDRRCSEDKPIQPPQTYPGLRRATVAYNQPLTTTTGTRSDVSGGRVEMRPHSVDVLNGEQKPDKKMPIRRSTASSDSQELLPSNGCPDSIPSAYHRTERLLSADFTVQGLGRKTSKGERSRRDARRQSEFDNAGRRPSETYNGARHSRSDFPDGMDDVFATKIGLEAQSGDAGRRRESYARKQKDKEFNLEMLDTALAGLQASANSPSDDSGPSQEVLQSPQSGKTTPGFYIGQGQQPQSATGTLAKPFGNDPSSSSTSADVSTSLKTSQAPRFVRDSSKYWHKPNIARDEAIDYLKGKPPGTFIIRNSNSFPGAFGLALKVAHLPPHVHSRGVDPKAELVRHFLIEPTLKGVKLKGCSSEPVFGSLAALVYQHSQTPLSLPCKLIIPDSNNLKTLETTTTVKSQTTASEVLSQGAACNVLYINSVDMESLTGYEAINKAVAWTFKQSPAPLTTLVHFKVSSQGVTLTDTNRKLFFRRHYPVDTVTFAGMDPEDRNWTWANEETKTSVTAKIFGFVARKQGSPTDNACHIFAELDADQPGSAIVEFIMKVMLGRGRSKQDSI